MIDRIGDVRDPTVFFAPTLQPDQQSPQCRQAYCITPATFGPGLWEIVIGGNRTERPTLLPPCAYRQPPKALGPGTGATPALSPLALVPLAGVHR
jgi:hypothetical protein